MSRRVFSKPLSDEGRENYDRIFGPRKKKAEVLGTLEVLADGPHGYADIWSVPPIPADPGRSADAGGRKLAGGAKGHAPKADNRRRS